VSLAACGSSAGTDPGGAGGAEGVTSTSITLGTTTTALTGPAASTCTPVNVGTQARFKSVNAKGGINGRKIIDEVKDDQYTAPNALENVRGFISQPVFAVLGGCGSIQPPAIAPVLQSAGVPYLFPQGASPNLNSDSDAYLNYPQYQQIFPSLVSHEIHEHGPGSVFVIAQSIPGSQQTISGIEQATKAAGGTYIGADSPPITQTDWNADALKIKQNHVDYVALVLTSGQAAAVVNTMAAQNALPAKEIAAKAGLTRPATTDLCGQQSRRSLHVRRAGDEPGWPTEPGRHPRSGSLMLLRSRSTR
jgi:ABC-type branched-subunit amino acid transport system substrate-binding protein